MPVNFKNHALWSYHDLSKSGPYIIIKDGLGNGSFTVPIPVINVVFPLLRKILPSAAKYSLMNYVFTLADVDEKLLFKLVEFLKLRFVSVTADEGQRLKELLVSMGFSFELSMGFPSYSNEKEYKSDDERCDSPLLLIDSPPALCINESPKFSSPQVEENVVDGINPLANVEDNVKEEVI